jgi:hypothetical protein
MGDRSLHLVEKEAVALERCKLLDRFKINHISQQSNLINKIYVLCYLLTTLMYSE